MSANYHLLALGTETIRLTDNSQIKQSKDF